MNKFERRTERIKAQAKKKRGPKQHEPTPQQRRQVEAMAGYGIPQVEIAMMMGFSARILETQYRTELDLGATKANAKVTESLYQQAVDGNVTAQIWWTKCRMGWKEGIDINVNNQGKLDAEPLPEDQWAKQYGSRMAPTNGAAKSTH